MQYKFLLFSIGICFSLTAIQANATAACEDYKGAAFGLCKAAYAVGCDSPNNENKGCARIEEQFSQTTGEAAPWVVTQRIIFKTSTYHNGNLGGVAGADAICQARATAAGLPGTYKAWIADSLGNSPSTAWVRSSVPYVNTVGTQIAADWADLADGYIENTYTDEFGVYHKSVYWTATGYDGSATGYNNCNNWISSNASFYGQTGVENEGGYWTYYDNSPCSVDNWAQLVCGQQ